MLKSITLLASALAALIVFAPLAAYRGTMNTFEVEIEADQWFTEVPQSITEVWKAIQTASIAFTGLVMAALGTRAPDKPIPGTQMLRGIDLTNVTNQEELDRNNQFPGSAGMARQLNTSSALV